MRNFKEWTKRGEMTANDLSVIEEAVKNDSFGIGKIVVTGEVYATELTVESICALEGLNELTNEPLFITTKNRTIRMLRFEPEKVWRTIHPDTFTALVKMEEKRLGTPSVILDEFDFYYSMVETMRQEKIKEDKSRPPVVCPVVKDHRNVGEFYQFMYLASLMLFNKPGYMAVPITEHFALPETVSYMENVKFRQVNEYEESKYQNICKTCIDKAGITNNELDFLSGLFESHANK